MMTVPAPGFDPTQRDPAGVAPAESYRRDDPVWVFRNGCWHAGVVNGVSPLALMVTYQRTGVRGTVVDTVTPEFVVPHSEPGTAGGDR